MAVRFAWLVGRPIWLHVALDGAAVVFSAGTFLQLTDPDLLIQCVWVVLAIEAFLFGLRVTALRLVAATTVVAIYAILANGTGNAVAAYLADLELREWPLMVVIAVVVAIMADRTSATSQRYARLYRRAQDRLLTAQEDERKRLALDLHDAVGQTLTALTLTLDAASSALIVELPDRRPARSAVKRARELASLALDETRDVALRLRPARLHEAGLVASIKELAARAGRPVAVAAQPGLVRQGLLTEAAEVETYRIVQEAVANAIRHSGAKHTSIHIAVDSGHLGIKVADDGIGFDPVGAVSRGLGVEGMRERAATIGAALTIASTPANGSVVMLFVPLAAEVAAEFGGQQRPEFEPGPAWVQP